MNKSVLFMALSTITTAGSAAITTPTNIPIPDGSFEGITASVTPPLLLGTSSGPIGAWTAKMTGLLSVGGSIQAGTAASLGSPSAVNGTYDLKINLPASAVIAAEISQTLTNQFLPNTVYTLTASLDQGTVVNLIGGATLSLNAGSTTVASLSGGSLATILNTGSSFQTVQLTYQTGNTVTTNGIGISLEASGTANVGGNVYVDNFQLMAAPVQIQFNPAIVTAANNLTLSGSGGTTNAQYQLITTTSLANPAASWTSLGTNYFDASGNFSMTIPIDHTTPARFYRLYLP